MHLFYAPDIINQTEYALSNEESKHAVKVLRLKTDDAVVLIDGKGGWFNAKVSSANPKACLLSIINKEEKVTNRNFKLTIAVAPTKNNTRLEWFLEKATEIGVDRIIPIVTHHSERVFLKPERLNKVLVSAMKQSLKAHLPQLAEITPFKDVVAANKTSRQFIAHCRDGNKEHLLTLSNQDKDVIIYVGPEGDFSEDEVAHALENNLTPISLGEERLRTETAALSACHIANLWKYA